MAGAVGDWRDGFGRWLQGLGGRRPSPLMGSRPEAPPRRGRPSLTTIQLARSSKCMCVSGCWSIESCMLARATSTRLG
jgi:hypothetical protein